MFVIYLHVKFQAPSSSDSAAISPLPLRKTGMVVSTSYRNNSVTKVAYFRRHVTTDFSGALLKIPLVSHSSQFCTSATLLKLAVKLWRAEYWDDSHWCNVHNRFRENPSNCWKVRKEEPWHTRPRADSMGSAIPSRGKVVANAVRNQPGIEPELYSP